MHLAFSTLGCPEWTLEQAVDAARRYGYQGLELRLLDGAIISPALDGAERARIKRVCAGAGIAICGLGASFKVADPDANLEEAYASLELAADIGAPLVRLFGGAPAGEAWATTVERASGRLEALARRGSELGVRVGLETHDSFRAAQHVAAILAATPHQNAGALWDTLHTVLAGEQVEDSAAMLATRLFHVHIKDGGVGPTPTECRLLGEGRVPTPDVLRALAQHGYAGWLSVEWEKHWQPQIPGPEVALPQYAERLRAYLGADHGAAQDEHQ